MVYECLYDLCISFNVGVEGLGRKDGTPTGQEGRNPEVVDDDNRNRTRPGSNVSRDTEVRGVGVYRGVRPKGLETQDINEEHGDVRAPTTDPTVVSTVGRRTSS